MSATITDSDGTVLALDDTIVAALDERHALTHSVASDGSFSMWTLTGGDEDAQIHNVFDATVSALAVDTLRALVREKVPDAFAEPVSQPFMVGKPIWWWVYSRGGVMAHGERVRNFGFDEDNDPLNEPTELQAWHAAYTYAKIRENA